MCKKSERCKMLRYEIVKNPIASAKNESSQKRALEKLNSWA